MFLMDSTLLSIRLCSVCKKFPSAIKASGRPDYICKVCRSTYIKEHYIQNRDSYIKHSTNGKRKKSDWLAMYKSSLVCEECTESHPACLDFHHTDPSQKDYSVCKMVHRYSVDRILEEIRKCKVLCSNCHRKLHYESRKKQ